MSTATQLGLVDAIINYLAKCRVLDLNERQLNAVIKAATDVMDAIENPHKAVVDNEGLRLWWDGDETGVSSRTMARHLAPIAGFTLRLPTERFGHFGSHPHDPADLNRCLGLLRAVPEFVPHVASMATVSPQWAVLVGIWDELVALMAEEVPTGRAPKTYARMRAVLDPIERPNMVKGGA